MLTDADVQRLAEEFGELTETPEQALQLARRVCAEIIAVAAPLQRRVSWLEEALAGHEASALLRRF